MSLNQIQQVISNRSPQMLGIEQVRQYAVFLPLVNVDGELQVLFQERAHHLKSQPGEICFPGGRVEKEDRDHEAAAIRETCEELGLSEEDLECYGPLDYLLESHRAVFPFAGRILHPEKIQPSEDEVASLFYVPLKELKAMEPEIHTVDMFVRPKEDFPFEDIPQGRGYMWKRGKWNIYFYYYKDRIIWGLTARILSHFLELVKK